MRWELSGPPQSLVAGNHASSPPAIPATRPSYVSIAPRR
jgi:hypothetical protein